MRVDPRSQHRMGVFDVEEYLLRRAALTRARSEREIVDEVVVARSAGVSWNKIGEILGTSAQAAQQRYSAVVEQT